MLTTLAGGYAYAKEPKPSTRPAEAPNPAFARVADDPKLPRVLLLGDSISIGYTLPVRDKLKGKANVHRPAANCGPTTSGVKSIKSWLDDGKWDVIHFNFGLHDLRCIDNAGNNAPHDKGHVQVPVDQYEKNLEQIVQTLKQTGAILIFATTTPVPAGQPQQVHGDPANYNDVALRVMKRNGVQIDDLYSFCLPRLNEIQLPGDVHFSSEGYDELGEVVARQVDAVLKK